MIQTVDLKDERVLGYRIDGDISLADMTPLLAKLKSKVAHQPTHLRAYAEYVHIGSISPNAFWEDLKADASYLSAFEKAAVVTDKEWVGWPNRESVSKLDYKSVSLFRTGAGY